MQVKYDIDGLYVEEGMYMFGLLGGGYEQVNIELKEDRIRTPKSEKSYKTLHFRN